MEQHNHMLSAQFLLATKQTGHANFSGPYSSPPRLMKRTLHSQYEQDIAHLHAPDGNDSVRHRIGLSAIHTEAVAASIAKLEDNKVLGRPAPEVDISVKTLPRGTRSTLCQLRSGYSSSLRSTMHSMYPQSYDPLCPKCQGSPHDTGPFQLPQ